MHPAHFHRFIIRPTLRHLAPDITYSIGAEVLLLGTALHESADLTYWKQGVKLLSDGNGVARGPYGIEPPTHRDIYNNVLAFRSGLAVKIAQLSAASPSRDDQLITNPMYATAIARVQYWRWPEPMPKASETAALAQFHELRYNTKQGAIGRTKELEALDCFQRAYDIVINCPLGDDT